MFATLKCMGENSVPLNDVYEGKKMCKFVKCAWRKIM